MSVRTRIRNGVEITVRNKRNYAEFVKTDFWNNLRRQCYARDNWRCRDCKQTGIVIQAHHIHYPPNWFDTKLEHLISLCKPCHDRRHPEKRHKQNHKTSSNNNQPTTPVTFGTGRKAVARRRRIFEQKRKQKAGWDYFESESSAPKEARKYLVKGSKAWKRFVKRRDHCREQIRRGNWSF